MRKISIAAALITLTLMGAGCSTEAPEQNNAPQAQAPVVTPKFALGTKVEAKWKGGSFYKGTIAAFNADGTYAVNYDDGDKEAAVKEENIKLQAVAPAYTYKVGEKVEAHWKGGQTWWKGAIAAVNADGTYNINFDDGDKEMNLGAASIRLRQ